MKFGKGFSKRKFYIKETIHSKGSARNVNDKQKVLELAEKDQILKTSKELVEDPFVLEFLDIKKIQIIYANRTRIITAVEEKNKILN